jgi:hypothetical protein
LLAFIDLSALMRRCFFAADKYIVWYISKFVLDPQKTPNAAAAMIERGSFELLAEAHHPSEALSSKHV